MRKPLRFAVIGAGFWSQFQIAAWRELPGVQCVALCNRTRSKAEALARRLGVPAVYEDAEELLLRERLDFIDIITDAETHSRFVLLAARHRVAVICQKPMALSLPAAAEMVKACRQARIPFFVHENWRWQTPIRQIKKILAAGKIGNIFRVRIDMISGFKGWLNQPLLAQLERFILTDLGTHVLDTARFLFGEADRLFCVTHRTLREIKGENVATVLMRMNRGQTTVLCEMAYAANALERECFPQTLIFIEGDQGSIELAPDYWIRVTTKAGTHARRHPPPLYNWIKADYAVVQSAIVPCNANLLGALTGQAPAETTGEGNLKTLQLVFAAYDSAATGKAIMMTN